MKEKIIAFQLFALLEKSRIIKVNVYFGEN